MQKSEFSRRIKSFVIRSGRMTENQQKGWTDGFLKHGFSLADSQFNWDDSYIERGPRVLEIGFGMGDSLLTMAEQNPDQRFLGVEVHAPGVGKLLSEVERRGIANVKVFAEDAVRVLEEVIPVESIDLLHIFFPDPWHKKRHQKRRIVQRDFVDLAVKKMAPGATLHLATDWEPYAQHMMEVLTKTVGLENTAGSRQFAPRPASRPETKFERRGHRLGHGVWDLIFIKS
ncbi:MAG: tRNA (guanosine(46)-N7)-methyltransferase TrmB [Luminiphilus sp.]|jgi:tRNA (guanine-N7-)-methyltransferase|nr:tRNA (guanosine(46)-N7)-methyltransferase TrmB [Luminiphilus sp.]MDA0890689.1 tRNA (guanosine(46)-N7)-methyltransferase TrmB [Pseudomonadota bacterium]